MIVQRLQPPNAWRSWYNTRYIALAIQAVASVRCESCCMNWAWMKWQQENEAKTILKLKTIAEFQTHEWSILATILPITLPYTPHVIIHWPDWSWRLKLWISNYFCHYWLTHSGFESDCFVACVSYTCYTTRISGQGLTMAITETVLNAGPHHHMLLHPSFLHTHMRSQSAQCDCRSHHWNTGLHHRGHPLHEGKHKRRRITVRRTETSWWVSAARQNASPQTHTHICKT